MAKKKNKKEEKKKSTYQTELLGILYILIAIIGFGYFGIVGRLITSFAAFLVGSWYSLLLIFVFVVGIYMMVKRDKPNFFTSKLFGLYIIIISVLIFSHLKYLNSDSELGFKIITNTINNFMKSTYDIEAIQGGGIIGSLFTTLFVALFDINGTNIVSWALFISGIIMFTGLTISDMLKKVKNKSSNLISNIKKIKNAEEIKKEEEKYENDNKIVISSVDELIQVSDNKEVKVEETKEEHEEKEELFNSENADEIKINKGYKYPPINLLNKPVKTKNVADHANIKENVNVLTQVFIDFGVSAKVVAVNVGPSVTQYEVEIKAGTKVNKILSINKEIALALAAKDIRIQAPIPGKKTIGVEIPNKNTNMVTVREMLDSVPKDKKDSHLLVTLGKDIVNESVFCEINKTPHLLVAGATGSGKSVCINSIIISLLMRNKPEEVKLILVDPKKVELSMFNGVPHLLTPVVTDPKKANIALKKIVVEMDRRYDLFSESGTKNIAGYNMYIQKKNETLSEEDQIKKLPFIVVIIDELADLMLVAAKEVEESIMRITQMARAAGIHLIVATQRPSTDVITGLIKANIPSRIAFAVSSNIDSRTILDMAGAEKLLGKGDMLYLPMGESTPVRVQGTFISEEEIKAVVDHTIAEQKAKYDETLLMDEEEMRATTMVEEEYDDPLYNEIVEFVVMQGKASASLLQRRFRLGYNRAARVIDLLEERGIIGPNNGSKPREVLVRIEDKE